MAPNDTDDASCGVHGTFIAEAPRAIISNIEDRWLLNALVIREQEVFD